MTRYCLTIEYEGTNYVGWQRQKTGASIQQELEEAVEQGAVESLVIEAGMLRSEDFWTDTASQVRAAGGEVVQASADHDAGEQLMGMGGAIGLLRWKIE